MSLHLSRAGRVAIAALALAGAAAATRAVLRVSHGLRAEYFTTTERIGEPSFTAIDPTISTEQVAAQWSNALPNSFSVRWTGFLIVPDSGFYQLATTSDDGSWLQVDGRLVVDNGGQHGALTRAERVQLDRGPHFILLEYVQTGGLFDIQLQWARDGQALSRIPDWRLSPNRASAAVVVVARVVTWVWWLSLATALVAAWIALAQLEWRPTPALRRPRLACLALFVVLAVVQTWPLATDPVHLSRNDNADTVLNEWILSWVAHRAPRAPFEWIRGGTAGLFDANIFYPERNTLAYSEAMIVQAAMGAPLRWIGASPVLTYNLVLLAGFALTGWAMCLVLARWTGDWIAAIAGGILMAFNAHTLTRLPHLQVQHVEFLPFALLALDALLVAPGIRRAMSLAAWFTLQALTSFYLLVFTAIALATAALARPEAWWGKRAPRVAWCLAVAAAVAGVLLLPYLLPYWRLHHDQGFARSLDDVAGFAATWRDYVTTPGRLPRLWLAQWTSTTGLYPGATAMALVAVAIVSGVALRDPRPRMCLAFGVCAVILSFGPAVPGYAWLYNTFTPLQGIRAISRFGYLALVAVAVLASYGFAWGRSRVQQRSMRIAASALVLALVTIEPLAAPIGYTRAGAIPRIYERLAAEPGAIVAELPLPIPRGIFFNAAFMLNSTVHWKPLVNGYSGFAPASYYEHYHQLKDFPSPEAVAALQRLGVTHAFVHADMLAADRVAAVDRVSALQRVAAEGAIVLYRVTPGPQTRP